MVLEKWIAPILASYLKDYVEGLDANQLKAGIWGGDIGLRNLRLKKGALDKFRLPVDVVEGFIGNLSIKITWSLLKEHPVQVEIDDVYLLAVPAAETKYDPQEDAEREHAVKLEKLRTAELLTTSPVPNKSPEQQKKDEAQMEGMASRIIDNLQITVKRVHLRYEDRLSVPDRPFAVGVTLAGFSAQSTDDQWQPSYIVNSSRGVHKLANLESLAAYFDTNATSLAGLSPEEATKTFNALIASDDNKPEHEFVLKPVSGQGRLLLHKKWPAGNQPKTSAELLFDQIGIVLNDEQYRDANHMAELFQRYERQHQYMPFKPSEEELQRNKPRALLNFACRAIRHDVHAALYPSTWAGIQSFAADRKTYVDLFKKRTVANQQTPQPELDKQLDQLERKYNYRQIRLFRSLARAELKKAQGQQRALEVKNQQQGQQSQKAQQADASASSNTAAGGGGWVSWLWGSGGSQVQRSGSQSSVASEDQIQPELDESSRKQLDDFFDWDQSDLQALTEASDMPPEAVSLKVHAKLNTGSFILCKDPHGANTEMVSLMFDALSADYIKRPENYEAALALGGMRVYDYTCPGSLHTEVVRVKADGSELARKRNQSASLTFDMPGVDEQLRTEARSGNSDPALNKPFFFAKFEHKPLLEEGADSDKQPDARFTVRLRYTEIFYHAGFVEEVFRFFKPPKSDMETHTALIDAASRTIENVSKVTQAQIQESVKHRKIFDLRVDINAPVIILPEDVTRPDCLHMIVDAGHIGIVSDLPSKSERTSLIDKREKGQLTTEERKSYESLVYNRFIVRLQSTQIVLGDRLESCMDALQSDQAGALHLLAKINMDWTVENRIAPQEDDTPQLRMAGHLPDLSLSLSDRKYRSLMRMLDVCVPHLGSDQSEEIVPPGGPQSEQRQRQRSASRSSRGRSRSKSVSFADRYDDDDDFSDEEEDETDNFYEAPAPQDNRSQEAHRKMFQIDFSVDRLSAAISRSHPDASKPDRLLAVAVLEGFRLGVGKRTYDMAVDVVLRTLYIEDKMVSEDSGDFRNLVTSKKLTAQDSKVEETDLVRVRFVSCDAASPEFQTLHEGFHKTVDVEMSTLNLIITRASILMILDFILTTFTDSGSSTAPSSPTVQAPTSSNAVTPSVAAPADAPAEKMRIKVKLSSIVFVLNDDGVRLATLELAAGDVAVLLRGATLRVSARLGNLSVTDDLKSHCDSSPDFRQLLSIKDDEVADFLYETFDPNEHTYPGYDTLLHLKTGSLQFTFLEEPIHQIIRFLTQFGKMKAVFDSTRNAAPPAPKATTSKMHFDVVIKTPIILFPRAADSTDVLVANLGEFRAKNSLDGDAIYTDAGLRAIRLTSLLEHGDDRHELEMLSDVNLDVKITEDRGIDRTQDQNTPDTVLQATLSDIKMHLTERQYAFCMALATIIPRAMGSQPEEEEEDRAKLPAAAALPSNTSSTKEAQTSSTAALDDLIVDLYPELPRAGHTVEGSTIPLYPKMQLRLNVQTISLDLFSGQATDARSLRHHGIARCALNNTRLFYRTVSNDSVEAELCTKSLRLTDTDVNKNTKWREIVPASKHENHDQIMLSYSKAAGPNTNAVANLTIDTPTVLFSLEPIYSLKDFFLSAFNGEGEHAGKVETQRPAAATASQPSEPQQEPLKQGEQGGAGLDYRVNIACAKIMLLSDPERADTEALVLTIDQLQMAQQSVLALSVSKLGMSLCKMDNQRETISLLDEFDLTLSLDSRAQGHQAVQNISLDVEPIILRVSYRDVMLVQHIVQKAIDLSNQSGPTTAALAKAADAATSSNKEKTGAHLTEESKAVATQTAPSHAATPQAMMSRQSLKATFDGLQLILVGDLQELPLLKIEAPKFMATASDWSSDLVAKTIISPAVIFFNLSNSQWEPLVDPWEIQFSLSSLAQKGKMAVKLESKKRLEVNLSSTFIDIANTTIGQLNKEADAVIKMDRGARAPFLVRNRTGFPLLIKAETGRSGPQKEPTRIDNGKDIPWRFDDWRTMRENVKSSSNWLTAYFEGTQWSPVEHIAVDKEGEGIYSLKPKVDNVRHRLTCEVILKDNVKIVTFRSTFNVQNLTSVPVELVIVDENNRKVSPIMKIAPGGDCPVPIESAYHHYVLVRPDAGFGHDWPSTRLGWQDLVKKPSRRIVCPSKQQDGPPFIIQAYGKHDKSDPMLRSYPHISMMLRSPLEVENLLPYDINFRLYDKVRDTHPSPEYLRKGGATPIHRADLWNLLMLNVQIDSPRFNRPSEFAIINTHNHVDLSVEDTMAVEDKDKIKLQLRLNFVRIPDAGGAFKVQIYSPYVLVNKTGLGVGMRASRRDFYQSGGAFVAYDQTGQHVEPILFSMPQSERKAVLAQLKVLDAEWSKAVPINTPGPAVELVLSKPSPSNNASTKTRQLRIGMRVTEGLGAYQLSRVVTIYPRYLVRNDTSRSIRLRQLGDDVDALQLAPGQRQPLMELKAVEGPPQMCVAIGQGTSWTPAFILQDVGQVYLRYQRDRNDHEVKGLLQAEVLVEGPTLHVHFNEPLEWPYLIRNDLSNLDLEFCQTMPEGMEAARIHKLPRNSTVEYAFDQPAQHVKSITVWSPDRPRFRRDVGIMEIGPQKPFMIPKRDGSDIVAIDTFAREHTQTITFSAYDIASNAYKKVSDTAGAQGQQLSRAPSTVSASTGQSDFEIAEPEAPVRFEVDLALEGVGISLINKRMVELAYCSFRGFHVNYKDTDVSTSISFSCKWIQFDNQLHSASFNVFLYPQVIPKDGKDLDARPNVEAQVNFLKDQSHGVIYCKYASILIQEMTIEVDEEFIYSLMDLISSSESAWEGTVESKLLEEGPGIPEPQAVEAGKEVYFEVLHLHPIALNISFMRTDAREKETQTFLDARNPISFALNALTMTLGNVNDASIKLSALYIENLRASTGVLIERAWLHYAQQFMGQTYRVIFSADFLGNPIGLFNNVSSGVADIFYQPVNGFVVHGNTDIGYSIAKGTGSFVKKTVFGFSDSFAKFTGSVGKGLAAATLDREFQSKRRLRISRNKPKQALEGISGGASSFGLSFASGVEGLARMPAEGADQDGAAGFFRGMGKAAVGLVTKPAVGFFDMANNVTEGIRNTTTVFDPSGLDRVRLPRVVPYDGVLRPYSYHGALGQNWLREVDNGKFDKDLYIAHQQMLPPGGWSSQEDYVVMMTTRRIMCLRVTKLKMVWEMPMEELSYIESGKNCAILVKTGNIRGPDIHVSSEAAKNQLLSRLTVLVQSYNSRKVGR